MCLMGRGPGERVDISLSCVGDDDNVIIQSSSVTHNILTTKLVDTKLSCSNFCLLIYKTDVFLVVFTRYEHYVFTGESLTPPMTFSIHYKLYKQMWKKLGVRSSKVTDCHRPTTAIKLQQMHVADNHIAYLALWLYDS